EKHLARDSERPRTLFGQCLGEPSSVPPKHQQRLRYAVGRLITRFDTPSEVPQEIGHQVRYRPVELSRLGVFAHRPAPAGNAGQLRMPSPTTVARSPDAAASARRCSSATTPPPSVETVAGQVAASASIATACAAKAVSPAS